MYAVHSYHYPTSYLLHTYFLTDTLCISRRIRSFCYAYDAVLFNHISGIKNTKIVYTDLDSLHTWIKESSLNLINIDKCRVVSCRRKTNIIKHDYSIGNEIIEITESAKLGTAVPNENFNIYSISNILTSS